MISRGSRSIRCACCHSASVKLRGFFQPFSR
ncbi:hypothetical protein [Rhodobacter sp. 24-YEA-8]